MEVKELRVGNIVIGSNYDTPGKEEFHEVNAFDLYGQRFNRFDPIPLTPETLLLFGFEETSITFTDGSSAIVRRSIELTNRLSVNVNGNTVTIVELPERIGEVKYTQIDNVESIHRLQNIVHSFTGHELKYNPQHVRS